MVGLGTGGQVTIVNGAGWVNIVVDGSGWYTDKSVISAASGRLSALAPDRILDTRGGNGAPQGRLGQQATMTVQVAGRGGVPAMTSTTPPSAVIINVTATDGSASSYLAAYPGLVRPGVSDLNWTRGETRPNLVVVKLAPDGTITIYNALGSVDVVGDVVGWFN